MSVARSKNDCHICMCMMIIGIVFLLYFALLIFLIAGWKKTFADQTGVTEGIRPILISVIIPVRNEEKNISDVLADLKNQVYSLSQYEVIVVNDHSSDQTEAIVRKLMESEQTFRLFNLTLNEAGKKFALAKGIEQAVGEVIVTTDADCRLQPGWLSTIAAIFQDDKIKMAVGPVKMNGRETLWGKMQTMEFASLIGLGVSTLGWKIPTVCNGANLAYRREVFNEVNGFTGNEEEASGDDEFLLRKVIERYPKGVKFNSASQSVVNTGYNPDWKTFMNQRIRWAAKWKKHGFGFSSVLALFLLVFNLSFLTAVALAIAGLINPVLTALLVSAKIILEFVCLLRVSRFLNGVFSPFAFLMLQIVYPFYVIFFGLAVNFMTARWKDRKI